ncbi:EVE domain-containing protein [candidate division KSB3 bacterium]|uniref:EVE domain-containing protein n=1 Tax=candidate division KSB3 bacterium TaxID=2044937 RepID=A0A2G6K7D2_9BACT|nr:MAG: EVE domain-containing protein [candidate division KSB3 bacterium]
MKYWLMKSDPDEFSIEDLKNRPNQTEPWDGVRNYQARNFMRDEMQIGDKVLFYHSQKNPSIVGTATVVTTGYPDHTAWDPQSSHFDSRSTPETPVWYMVDIQLDQEFSQPLTLKFLRTQQELDDMMLLRKGIRLSVQPVTQEEFEYILLLNTIKSK